MLPQITVQLYSLRDQLAEDFEGTLQKVAAMGYPCVETAGYHGRSPKQVTEILKALDLCAPTAHSELPIGDAKNEIIETALKLGHRYLITGGPPGGQDSYTTLDEVKRIAELYSIAAENVKEHGMQVGYHNHDWDLAEIEGQLPHQLFLANTPESVLWQADLFWIAKAGINPIEFLKEIGPRGKALHFKDGHLTFAGDQPPYLPAGQGDIDLVGASKAACFAEFITVELDEYTGNMLSAVEESYDYLTKMEIAKGRP
jgi:sugar phosphate isomerase/epimerase